jgi:hypothetical protein
MTESPNTGPVIVSLHVEGFGESENETHEIPRAEWDAMTPVERVKAAEEAAGVFAGNCVGWGWHIDDPQDYAATEDVAPTPTERPVAQIARDAIRALEAFGVTPERRYVIGGLLVLWARYDEMSVYDIEVVLDHFRDGGEPR